MGRSRCRPPGLLELLAEREVCLDVCPSSNIALSVFPSMEEHPLPRLLAAGVPVSLGSDCPLFRGVTVADEYRTATERLGLGPFDLGRMAGTSPTASSCPPDRRAAALAGLRSWLP